MKTMLKQVPLYYSPLFILILLAILVPGTTLADCPDKAVKCNTFVKGWQGTCFNGISCKPCGSPHCPKRPLLKDMRSRAILDAPAGQQCRATLTKSKLEYTGNSVCSVPDIVPKKLLSMAHLIFGRSACMEHDICYDMPGMNQTLCDTMFYDNMIKACDQYYYGHLKKRPRIKVRNHAGHGYCIGVAKSFYQAVKRKGQDSFYPDGGEESCQGIDAPPRLNTRMHLGHLGGSNIIRVVSVKGESDKPGKVKVCLLNKTKRWKGLHFKRSKTAKYQAAKKNSKSCGHYTPGEKTFYFYKKTLAINTGYFDFRKLDLTGYAGYEVKLIWEKH